MISCNVANTINFATASDFFLQTALSFQIVVSCVLLWYNIGIMIKLTPLFSGSRGNCTLIQTPQSNILLDAGYGFRAIVARLAQADVALGSISAVVITHEHSDHISALPQLVKYSHAPIYVPTPSASLVQRSCYCGNVQNIDGSFDMKDVHVEVYRCSHDSRACFGYRFETGDDCVASVTDTGEADDLVNFLAPARSIILESNHDLDMLWKGDYPFYLKRRITSELGHLSNTQTAQILQNLVGSKVQNVVLAHLSQQNNTPVLAFDTAVQALVKQGAVVGKDVRVYVADQYKNEVVL